MKRMRHRITGRRYSGLAGTLFSVCITTLLLLFAVDLKAFAGVDQFHIEQIEWYLILDEVVITYDVIGPLDEAYEVHIVLLRKSDKAFKYTPRFVRGDIGSGVHAGAGREIRWAYKKDLLRELSGDDFYFELSIQRSRSFPWLVVAGGVVVGGGLAYLLLNSGSPNIGSTELPYPPPRP